MRTDAVPSEKVLQLAMRPEGFRVSWRHRDSSLRKRCFRMAQEQLLRFQRGKGEDYYFIITNIGREHCRKEKP